METKNLLKSLKRRLGLITTALAMLLVSQGMLASMTVTKDEVIIVDVSGHNWFSNDNCYPKVYIGSTVVGQAGGYSSTKSYSITITTTATGTMNIARFNGSSEWNNNSVTDRSNANQDKVSISGDNQWGGSWSNTKEYTYGQRYFYVDCTGFTSYPSVNCSFYWNNNCTDEAGYKKGMASCETNVYYHDLSTVSASYTYIRSFQVSQGEWYDKSNHTPAQNNNTNNCVQITGWGQGSWTSYALTPSTVNLEVSSGASSGTGTSNDPYIVEPGAEFTLSASGVTYSPADPNMSTRYAFGTSASSSPTGTSFTSEQTASSTETTTQYYVSVRGYYNSTYSKSYKSTSVYVKTKSACTTPTAEQYPMTDATKTYGSVSAPTITPASGAGTVEKTYYTGINGTSYNKSETLPTNAGTYKVTVDVNAGSTYCAKDGIDLSNNFVINKKAPTASDFNISIPASKAYDGTASTATVTAKSGISGMGDVTVKYNGNTTAPTTPGTYPVTFDVAEGTNYTSATGLSGDGSVEITKGTQATLTLSAGATKACVSGGSITFSTSGGTGSGAVTYAITSGTGGSITSGGVLTASQAGSFTVQATKAGGDNYDDKNSNTVSVSFDAASVAGTITGAGAVCSGGSASLGISGNTGNTFQWQKSTTSTTSGFSDISGATSSTLSTGALTQTTYYRVLVTNGVCAAATSEAVTETVKAQAITRTDTNSFNTVVDGSSAATNLTFTQCGYTVTEGSITLVGADAGDFTINSKTISGESITVNVTFHPTTTGSKTVYVQILDNTHQFQITATGACKSGVAASNFNFTNASVTYNGSEQKPTITPKDATVGAVTTVYYAGTAATGKTDAGTYAITIDSEAGTKYCGESKLSLGNFVINKAPQATLTLDKDKAGACVNGGSIQFSTSGGSGDGAVTYTINSGTGGSITNAGIMTATQAGAFTVQATKAASANYQSATSNNTVTVNFYADPTTGNITASPASPICKGTSTTLTIAGYTAGSTLQWYKGSSILTGKTSASYSTENLSEAATYKVVVSNNGCTSETAPITINVQEPTLTIALTSAAGGDKVYVWEPATFTPTTDGTITDKTITRQSGSGTFIVEDGANDAKIVKAGKEGDVFRASFTTSLNGCTKTVTKDVTVEKATESCD